MDDGERIKHLRDSFGKLQRNREAVPLEKLKTTYGKQYNALVAEITADADWFADKYLETLATAWPRHPRDTAGNDWLDRKVAAILQQEAQPGGRAERWRAALIDSLDMAAFEQLVWERYDRCEREAFDPYWQRHCRRRDDGWIYNDITQKFWLPPGADPNWPDGCWITNDYKGHDTRFPPKGGENHPCQRQAT